MSKPQKSPFASTLRSPVNSADPTRQSTEVVPRIQENDPNFNRARDASYPQDLARDLANDSTGLVSTQSKRRRSSQDAANNGRGSDSLPLPSSASAPRPETNPQVADDECPSFNRICSTIEELFGSDYVQQTFDLQDYLKPSERARIVQTIILAATRAKCSTSWTLELAVQILDRCIPKFKISRPLVISSTLQVTLLFTATKVTEPADFKIVDCINSFGLTPSDLQCFQQEVVRQEIQLLKCFTFNLGFPSAYKFATLWLMQTDLADTDPVVLRSRVDTLLQIALLDASLLVYSPSVMACAAIKMATSSMDLRVQIPSPNPPANLTTVAHCVSHLSLFVLLAFELNPDNINTTTNLPDSFNLHHHLYLDHEDKVFPVEVRLFMRQHFADHSDWLLRQAQVHSQSG